MQADQQVLHKNGHRSDVHKGDWEQSADVPHCLCRPSRREDADSTTPTSSLVWIWSLSSASRRRSRRRDSRLPHKMSASALRCRCSHACLQVVDLILKSGGPQANATKAQPTRFHDDKTTYTVSRLDLPFSLRDCILTVPLSAAQGVYAKGGPRATDNVITLSSLADRSAADARGIKK